MMFTVFWFISIFITIFISYKYFEYKFQKNNEKETLNKKQKEIEDKNHQFILENKLFLEKEKEVLFSKIKEKTIELAIKSKEDEDKIRLLHSVREKIIEAEENPNLYKMKLKEMRRLLDHYLDIDNKTFEIQMDELHQEFFKSMKKRFPGLSIYDLRLCAYLKLGLTSKEMSEILNVLPSSINVSRSRLRKKLGLNFEEDIYEFLNQI